MQPPLFHRVLGEDAERVPAVILAVHDIGDGAVWHGEATVEAGRSLLARLVRSCLALPPPNDRVPLSVEMTPAGDGEIWHRRFGAHSMASRLTPGSAPGTIDERLGGVTVRLRLLPDAQGVRQITEGVRLIGIPLPKLFWPTLDVRESADDDVYRFNVAMHLSGSLLLRYEGHLETRVGHEL